MRIAFSLWNERIAPVFDVARHLLLVDIEHGHISGQNERRFSSDDPQERALRLCSLQVEQLVCGAISREADQALTQRGIRVISFISGELSQVMEACLANRLHETRLAMPGCGRGRRRGPQRPPRKG